MSLVGFMFLRTSVLGIPVPFHTDLPEVNLRFYVRRREGDEWRRGVVFIQEIVPRPALTFEANTLHGEHYRTLPMQQACHGWDGRLGGQDAPVDMYVWRVVLERWAGGERVVRRFTGHMTLVR